MTLIYFQLNTFRLIKKHYRIKKNKNKNKKENKQRRDNLKNGSL
jgi:hypothetical protein